MRSILSLIRSIFNSKSSGFKGSSKKSTVKESERSLSKAQEIFKDQEMRPFDYSKLSRKQAQRLLSKRKKEDGFVDYSTYAGLKDALNAHSNRAIENDLGKLNDEQIKNWYIQKKKAKQWVTHPVKELIASRLKPAHESYLIAKMSDINKDRIKKWVDEKKKSGYFFSDKAYQKAIDIYLSK